MEGEREGEREGKERGELAYTCSNPVPHIDPSNQFVAQHDSLRF